MAPVNVVDHSIAEKNLTLKVYKSIRDMMVNYEIVPGQRLIFSALASQLGVSRTPVHMALSILAREGFLDFVPNQGYTVHKISQNEAENLYEIMKIFMVGGIGKAIRWLTPERLQELERRKIAYEKAVVEQVSRGRFILDQEYHACMLEMSNNQYLADYFREVYQRIYLRHRIESLVPERAREVVGEHHEIFEAIRIRDVEATRELLASHIDAGKKYIFSRIFDEK